MNELKRILTLDLPIGQSLFLWGARKTGKSTYLREQFPDSLYIDLLHHDDFLRFNKRPSALRDDLLTQRITEPVIIDEIQKVPELLDEVHWLIENKKIAFILCGSSVRKLKHSGSNLLGGRAWRQVFTSLCYPELPGFDLVRIFNHGLIPSHYLADKPERSLQSYISDYLIPEIQLESRIRQIGSFHRFLDAIVFSNSQILNYSNIAQECGINLRTVQAYTELLIDMLLAHVIFPYSKTVSRKLATTAPKFYFFDPGLVTTLRGNKFTEIKGPDAGHLFEQYVFLEIMAYRELTNKIFPIQYWRTTSGLEVDFILNRGQIAIEIKISTVIGKRDVTGIVAFAKEHPDTLALVVCREPKRRTMEVDGIIIQIYPIEEFLKDLWARKFIG